MFELQELSQKGPNEFEPEERSHRNGNSSGYAEFNADLPSEESVRVLSISTPSSFKPLYSPSRLRCTAHGACITATAIVSVFFLVLLIVLLVVLFFVLRLPPSAHSVSQPAAIRKGNRTEIRLSGALVPWHYDVELQPFIYDLSPESFKFGGSVSVLFSVMAADQCSITLHSRVNISLDSVVVRCVSCAGSRAVTLRATELVEEQLTEMVTIVLNETLKIHANYSLRVSFWGPLLRDGRGIYWSSYNVGSYTRYIASTHLEPTYARKAFPCFDEPHLKATFNVTLWRRPQMRGISNAELQRTRYEYFDGVRWAVDEFERTPLMSTYLLAVVVCDFVAQEQRDEKNRTFRVWTRAGREAGGRYALQLSIQLLNYFEELLGEPYALQKLDSVPVPDFGVGAMENWGCIIYNESNLLFDESQQHILDKQQVAVVVAHEIAHQWFGNLVTMRWWDDLWLNEGFTSFMQYQALQQVHPEWNIWKWFVINDLHGMLREESIRDSRPVYPDKPIVNSSNIEDLFDRISYWKGAVLCRMFRLLLTEDGFLRGVKLYLQRHKWRTANHTDLWAALTESSGVDVSRTMNGWLWQSGYPVLLVHVARDANGSARALELLQQRFSPSDFAAFNTLNAFNTASNASTCAPPDCHTADMDMTWSVPVTVSFDGGVNYELLCWMNGRQQSFSNASLLKQLDAPNSVFVVNAQQMGYYRVLYDDELWSAFTNQLATNHTRIHPINRAQLIDDAFDLAGAGYLNYSLALELLTYMSAEEEYLPWRTALVNLETVENLFGEHHFVDSENYHRFLIRLALPVVERIGWNEDRSFNESASRTLLRSLLVQMLRDLNESSSLHRTNNRTIGESRHKRQSPPDAANLTNLRLPKFGREMNEHLNSAAKHFPESYRFELEQKQALDDVSNKHFASRVVAHIDDWLVRYLEAAA